MIENMKLSYQNITSVEIINKNSSGSQFSTKGINQRIYMHRDYRND